MRYKNVKFRPNISIGLLEAPACRSLRELTDSIIGSEDARWPSQKIQLGLSQSLVELKNSQAM